MSLLSLIFNRPVKASIETTSDGNETIIVPMDASISETHERSASVTQNPIEDGTNIADHITLAPVRLTMEALISDSPVSLIQSGIGTAVSSASQLAQGAIGGIAGTLAGQATGIGLGSLAGLLTDTPRDPADGFRYLEELWENRQPFTVVTALKRYEKMVLTSLSVPRTAQIGKSLRFNATFEEVRVVKSSIVTVPAFKVGGNASAQSAAGLGKQATKEAGAETSTLALRKFQEFGILQQ